MLDELLELEMRGWRALSSDGAVAREFYGGLLSDDAVMLFPGGMVLEGKEAILASLDAQPWSTFEIEDPRVVELGDAAAVLAYEVTAQRQGASAYGALVGSAYRRRDGAWYLTFHQQTPI
jgi:ketosteroid isomerase-like protein